MSDSRHIWILSAAILRAAAGRLPGYAAWYGDMDMGVQVDPGQKGRQQAMKSNLTKIIGSHSLRAGIDIRQHFRTQLQSGGLTSGNFVSAICT